MAQDVIINTVEYEGIDQVVLPTREGGEANFIEAGIIPHPSDANPLMDGSASAGSSNDYSRADHVHPSDSTKANASSVYTKTEADALLNAKANASETYTKTEVDTLVSGKADASSVYTKTEMDTALQSKADSSSVYTKTETDTLLSAKASASDLEELEEEMTDYRQMYLDSLIHTTASGSIASFSDGFKDAPMDYCTATIEPVQDLHGQSNPYPAGGGKNLVDWVGPQTITAQTVIVRYDTSEQATFTASVTAVNNASVNGALNLYAYNDNALVKSKQTVILANATSARYNVTLDLSDTTYNNIRISISGTSSGYSLTISDVQLEKGSTATAFAPYSNICPISGWTGAEVVRSGKNLFDKANVNEVNGYFGSGAITSSTNHKTIYIECKPNTTYTVSNPISNRRTIGYTTEVPAEGVAVYGTSSLGTVTTGADAKYIVCYCYNSIADTATYQDVINALQIEIGSTASIYEPYQSDTYSVTWESEAGTIYGGHVDLVSGVLTVDRVIVDLGTLTWSRKTDGVFYTWGLQNIVKATAPNVKTNGICSALQTGTYNEVYNNATLDNAISVGAESQIGVHHSAYTDTASFKTAMSGVMFCYELAQPITYQLTPQEVTTLLGSNNVWADTGDTSVGYVANTKLYIDSRI